MFKKKKTDQNNQNSAFIILNNRFNLRLPTDWKDQSVYRYEGPEEDGIRHNIYVTIENNIDEQNFEKYAAKNIRAVEGEMQGYQELKRGKITFLSGIQGVDIVYKWCPVDNREVYQRAIYLTRNNTGYILNATFSKKTWKMLRGKVDKILMSFDVPSQ